MPRPVDKIKTSVQIRSSPFSTSPCSPTSAQIPTIPPPESVRDETWLWTQIKAEARRDAEAEPALASFLYATVISHPSLLRSLCFHLANKLSSPTLLSTSLYDLFLQVFKDNPSAFSASVADLLAARVRDPACYSYSHCLLNYKGYLALQAHRVANVLWRNNRRPMALALQSRISDVFDVDIHPAARIGRGVLLDHATGVVIGETAVVGDGVYILHHVTLGGTGKQDGDRHPKIGKEVLIGAGATVLGCVVVGDGAKIGAGSLVLKNVPPRATVVGIPARLVGQGRTETRGDGVKDSDGDGIDYAKIFAMAEWCDYII